MRLKYEPDEGLVLSGSDIPPKSKKCLMLPQNNKRSSVSQKQKKHDVSRVLYFPCLIRTQREKKALLWCITWVMSIFSFVKHRTGKHQTHEISDWVIVHENINGPSVNIISFGSGILVLKKKFRENEYVGPYIFNHSFQSCQYIVLCNITLT